MYLIVIIQFFDSLTYFIKGHGFKLVQIEQTIDLLVRGFDFVLNNRIIITWHFRRVIDFNVTMIFRVEHIIKLSEHYKISADFILWEKLNPLNNDSIEIQSLHIKT